MFDTNDHANQGAEPQRRLRARTDAMSPSRYPKASIISQKLQKSWFWAEWNQVYRTSVLMEWRKNDLFKTVREKRVEKGTEIFFVRCLFFVSPVSRSFHWKPAHHIFQACEKVFQREISWPWLLIRYRVRFNLSLLLQASTPCSSPFINALWLAKLLFIVFLCFRRVS